MRTARLLPVSPSMHCGKGESPLPGVSPCQGGLLAWGVSLTGESPLPGGGSGRSPLMDRILDTRYWKYYLAPTSLRAVKIGIVKILNTLSAKIFMNGGTCFYVWKWYFYLVRWHLQSMVFFNEVNFDQDGSVTLCVLVCEISWGSKFRKSRKQIRPLKSAKI